MNLLLILTILGLLVGAFVIDYWKRLIDFSKELGREFKNMLIKRIIFSITVVVLSVIIGKLFGVLGQEVDILATIIGAFIVSMGLSISSVIYDYLKRELDYL